MKEFGPRSIPEWRWVVRLLKGSSSWASGPGSTDGREVCGGSPPEADGTQLTLFHVKDVHGPEELGLPVEPTLPQASQAVQAVIQGHKAGEGPFTGNVGELGPGARLNVKDLKGVDCILGLSSPWRPEQGGGGTEE